MVMPLEGLWWVDDTSKFSVKRKDEWKWTTMIMQPKYVTQDLFKEAMKEVREKKAPAALDKVRFESYHEGKAAQIMHIGPTQLRNRPYRSSMHSSKSRGMS